MLLKGSFISHVDMVGIGKAEEFANVQMFIKGEGGVKNVQKLSIWFMHMNTPHRN